MIFPELREYIRDARQGFGSELLSLGLERRASEFGGQGPSFPVATLDKFLDFVSGGGESWSGAIVTPDTGLKIAVAWACIDRLASGLAKLPIQVLRDVEVDGMEGREQAKDHYLYRPLRWQANPYMTAFRFKRLLMVWLLQHGNAMAFMNINGRGQITELWPWHPKRVDVEMRRFEGVMMPFYGYRLDNGERTWQPGINIIHLRGLESDGFFGLSPIEQHAQTFGKQLAIMEHGARFFKNGARPLGVLQTDQDIEDKTVQGLREAWQQTHGGLSNSHKVAILTNGLKYHAEGISMVDAQYIEALQGGEEQICGIFNVPPHKVQILRRATNNNIEHQGLEWYQDSLEPHAVNFEQELTASCLSPREAQSITIEFLFDFLLRADIKSRGEYISKMVEHRVMTRNEARRKLNMNPVKGGDIFDETNNAKSPEGSQPDSDDEPTPGERQARELLVRHNGRH